MVTQDERDFFLHTRGRTQPEYEDQRAWPAEPGDLVLEAAPPTLPAEMVPDVLRGWVGEVAQRACFHPEFLAAPTLVAAGSVIGRSVGIMPNQFDDFLVVPNLWGAIIGRPGLMKSYAISEAVRPLKRLEAKALARFKDDTTAQGARRVRLQAELDAVRSLMLQDAKKDTGRGEELEQQYVALQAEIEKSQIKERRYATHDATIESFDRLLVENPRGLLVLRDELAGWIGTLSKPGREGDREFFLEAWNGTGSFTRDRVGRGTVHIEAVTLSVLGGIQPGKLQTVIEGALSGQKHDDGLLQRLQLLVWPADPGPWQPPQDWLDAALLEQAHQAFARLDQIGDLLKVAAHVGRATTSSEQSIPYVRFSPAAQELFDDWRSRLETRLRSKELGSMPAFEAHIAKYRSLMPSLALIFHLLSLPDGDPSSSVGVEAASLAADWCGFLEEHARRVYSAEVAPGLDSAPILAAKIRAGLVRDRDTIRDISRHGWAKLETAPSVRMAAAILGKSYWLRIVEEETGGRPTEIVRLHPRLRDRTNA